MIYVSPIAAATVAVDNTENVVAMQQSNKHSKIKRSRVKLSHQWKLDNVRCGKGCRLHRRLGKQGHWETMVGPKEFNQSQIVAGNSGCVHTARTDRARMQHQMMAHSHPL